MTPSSPRISALSWSRSARRITCALRADRQGHGRIGVADLCLDLRKVVAGGDHVRDVGPSERVWSHVRAKRRSALSGSDLVRSRHHGCDDSEPSRTLSLFRRLPFRSHW